MAILIARWLFVAIGFLAAAYLLPGIIVSSAYIALILAFLWGIVGIVVRPILILLTLPINILTFGLFTLVINAALLWFLSTFVRGFSIEDALSAFLAALIIAAVSWLGHRFTRAVSHGA